MALLDFPHKKRKHQFRQQPMSEIDKFTKNVGNIRILLNKLSESNFDVIQEKLLKDFEYTPSLLYELMKIIFMKSTTEQSFMELYVRLCVTLFKKFNDNFGHQLGDQVLRLVGRTLTDSVRDDDLPARYGGEEFGVLLPSAELDKAREIGERIRQQVGAKRIVKRSTGEDLGTITLSIGCSRYVHGEPVPDLVKRADAALYLAKRSGRNRVMTEDDLDRQG